MTGPLVIHPLVAATARQFGGESVAFAQLLQSVVLAEGGINHILAAVRKSIPETKTIEEALAILARSAVHHLADYVKASDPDGFVRAWALTWAPPGAVNDPAHLNEHWPGNVLNEWLLAV